MQKDGGNKTVTEYSGDIPDIPDGWQLRTSGLVKLTDMVLEDGKWISLVDIALETHHVLIQVPIEKFKVPVITMILDAEC